MGLTDWFRRTFSSSPAEPADEDAAAEKPDLVQDRGEPDLEEMKQTSGGAPAPGLAASQGTEAAEAQLADYEPPSDPTA